MESHRLPCKEKIVSDGEIYKVTNECYNEMNAYISKFFLVIHIKVHKSLHMLILMEMLLSSNVTKILKKLPVKMQEKF